MLKISNLHKEYPGGDLALRGVNLELKKGEITAVIGPSGAGKSTLIRCVNRLVEATEGEIILQDQDINKLNKKELKNKRRKMGMIFQEYALVERLTVMENVLSGRLGYVSFWRAWLRKFPQKDINQAYQLLERLGLQEHINKRSDHLSGGQRQRVGIARALIQDPDLLLVDEPTASLDPKTARQIMRLITEMAKERNLAALINIHDVLLAREYVSRIIGMRNGEIVFDGSPLELNKDTLTTIYGEEDWDNLNKENNIKENNTSLKGGNDFADREQSEIQLAASASN
ncbi:Phosphonate ABC transporter ATP-binding protein (TC 3.A.1.9.1) [Halanaerobium saccharolyticum subsp. saccharolyticum DSM 6643]|uniref:Phosphonate ABC transporter ATP-binding protein (TC 3.A.1.9.1) n=1 Tax=Halanaerobium saccharolyticum subsp. saccharolyticum DSM 6643 TaxID=1293054 RepID=M5DYU9_9FIRM|nr:phosphonate ABC transporter ATP-binding protein [Halanaerobium saccharolyticum]CCU78233.1 Phosphonate ABC transporter ATP-binding protein (TC 3.A.1.9.1) [Halanaerobium saccharolyticum subsp. saccharolyticum DSM 6643]